VQALQVDSRVSFGRDQENPPLLVLQEQVLGVVADHLVAMAGGRVIAAGDPGEVITEQTVRDVFGLDSRVVPDPLTGRPMVIPIGRHHTVVEPEQARA